MSTTKKKTRKTSKSTESRSKKRLQSSKTHSSKSKSTRSQTKKGSSQSGKASTSETSSLSTASDGKAKSKSSGSSPQEASLPKKKGLFQDYDYENLPELTAEQLKAFKRVSPEQHKRFSEIETIQVLSGGKVVETKKIGRPRKHPHEKENVVSIRLSKAFLQRLKKKAGKIGWQTYVKQVLEKHLADF